MAYMQRIKWTDKLVKEEIMKVIDSLSLNRMPTRKEIEFVTKNSKLTDRINRTKGYYGWAKELNLSIKDSETTLGKKYEFIAKKILEDKGYKVEKMSQNYPFDLLVNDNIKIDVKTGKIFISNVNSRYYTFNLYKKYATCDIYMIICLNENEQIEKLLIIPSNKLKITQLSLGKVSEYDCYINKFNYIDDYDTFYKQLA